MIRPGDGGGDLGLEGHGRGPVVNFRRQQQGLLKPAENTGFYTKGVVCQDQGFLAFCPQGRHPGERTIPRSELFGPESSFQSLASEKL